MRIFFFILLCPALAIGAAELPEAGAVNFANGAAGVNAPVMLKSTGQPLEGPNWRAQLLLRQSDSNFIQLATALFETGELAGYFFAGRIPVPGTKPGDSATLKIRITNLTNQLCVESAPITVVLGGEKSPPSNLLGLSAMQLPSPILLSIARKDGQNVTLSWPSEAAEMILQTTVSLPAEPWLNLATPRTTNGHSISTSAKISGANQFFRLSYPIKGPAGY